MSIEGSAGSGRRFHLLQRIGRGSYGEVFLAELHSGAGFRKKVALKLLNDDVARVRGAARRMRDEARVLGLLSHRHIVSVHDLVRVDERWAILMDWVPGADLEQVIEALQVIDGTFPVSAALEVGAAVFDALHFAASAPDGSGGSLGVIHRDIKPSNLRLTVDGDLKVLDFGGARFLLDGRVATARSSAWVGTERYMSPERILREGDTGAGDIYATGATLVELIIGRPMGRTPLDPEAHLAFVEEALDLVRARTEAEAVVVDRVIAALRSALAHDPSLRPTARQLGHELDALSRRVTGPTLHQFAREFVSRVDGLLGRSPEVATGTLLEGLSEIDLGDGSSRIIADGAPPSRAFTTIAVVAAVASAVVAFFLGVTAVAIGGELGRWRGAGQVAAAPAASVVEQATDQATDQAPMVAAPAVATAEAVFPPEGVQLPAVAEAPPPRRAAARRPAEAPPEEVPVVPPSPTGRIDRTVVVLRDASRLRVSCGDVSASGTASVRIMDFPAGPCTVQADWLGRDYATEITIDKAASVRCQIQDGTLQCP